MAKEADEQPAMDGRQVAIEHFQPVASEQYLDRVEIVVKQVLVVDLIERQILDDLFHVEKLDHKDAVVLETLSNPISHGMQFLEMEKHAGGIDQVELSIQPARDRAIEEVVKRFYS